MHAKSFLRRRKAAVIAALALTLAIGGVAFATYVSEGTGTGSVTSTIAAGPANTPVTVTDTCTQCATLAPGGTANVLIQLCDGACNSVAGATSLVNTVHSVIAVDAAHLAAGCAASNFTIPDLTGQNMTVTTTPTFLTGNPGWQTITMATAAPNACESASITITTTVS